MTDRPRPQQALATDLANLVFDVQKSSVVSFLDGFWSVLSKQWSTIDALRMDKFLLLVRRVFSAHVRYAREKKWKGKEVEQLLELLGEKCFDVREEGVALGLRLHVLDLWVDEMDKEKALVEGEGELRAEWVRKMGDLVDGLRASPVKAVRARAAESYEDERLPWGKKAEEEAEDDDEDEDGEEDGWGGIED